jgi:protein SCO1/2
MAQTGMGNKLGNGAIYVLIAVLAVAGGLWAAKSLTEKATAPIPQDLTATLWPEPKPLPAFSLVDHHGDPFTLDSLKGHWTFLFFGYTHCPDVCPTTLAMFDALARNLGTGDAASDTQFVFVSVDPERDPPERLAEYVTYFNPAFLGVTGQTEVHLNALTIPLGILHMKSPDPQSDGGYLVDHTASVILVDPRARLHAVFGPPHDAGAILKDYTAIRQRYDAAS